MKFIFISLVILTSGLSAFALDSQDDPNLNKGYLNSGAGAYIDQYNKPENAASAPAAATCDCDLDKSNKHDITAVQPSAPGTGSQEAEGAAH